MKKGDVMGAVDDAFEKGDLTITNEDGSESSDEPSFCPICHKSVSMSTCYAWFILNDKEYPDVIEMLFCSKECWKKYLNKERKRLI